jgi:hypothetical protein
VGILAEEQLKLNGREAVCSVELQSRVVSATGQGTDSQPSRTGSAVFLGPLGATIRRLTMTERHRYNLIDQPGMAIVFLCPKSPLVKAYFEVDDILLSINGQIIDSPKKLKPRLVSLKPIQRIVVFGIDHRSGKRGYAIIETHADEEESLTHGKPVDGHVTDQD